MFSLSLGSWSVMVLLSFVLFEILVFPTEILYFADQYLFSCFYSYFPTLHHHRYGNFTTSTK
eukprot:UN14915